MAERHRDVLAGDTLLESFDGFLEAPHLGLDRMVNAVCTDQRLLLLDRGALVVEHPWADVTALGSRRGVMFSMLSVQLADGTEFVLLNLPRRLAGPLARSLPPAS